ncbi:MAG: gamma-glutamyl-gamma-aminobutyrate hydrolase family protein [Clostridia bacterium]|nr:gamma-glutamyl-gamma-aminobutyrate hydrolase family protein [Clostridia bacterium]
MKRPVIGITPNYAVMDYMGVSQGYPYTPRGYAGSILRAGGIPLTFPFAPDEDILRQLIGLCDGFLFTGGQDVDPAIYGEMPWDKIGATAPLRDIQEKMLLPLIMETGKPVIGHCRGMQMINCVLGGSLYQDLPTQHPSFPNLLNHSQSEKAVFPTHRVDIREGTLLASCYGLTAEVNSFHHQAVRTVAPGLSVTATAPDGMIEGLEMKDYPYLQLVQWHPEEMTPQHEGANRWFAAFIDACR